MNCKSRFIRLLAALPVVFTLSLPAAHAADEPPPPTATPSAPAPYASVPAAPNSVPGAPPGCGAITGTVSVALNLPIPDFNQQPGVLTTTLNISGPGLAYLWDLNVRTYIIHTFNRDLNIYLISPAGTKVALSTRNGSSYDNIFNGTLWDDQAALVNPPGPAVTLATFQDNVVAPYLSPEQPLAGFIGEHLVGNWTLEIDDMEAGDTGALRGWELDYTTLAQAPTSAADAASNYNLMSLSPGAVLTKTIAFSDLRAPVSVVALSTVITSASPGALIVALVPPAGVPITLTQNQGDSYANVFAGTLWNDLASPVTDATFHNGVVASPLSPQVPLALANGTNANGNWTVVVQSAAGGQPAQVGLVFLTVTTAACLPDLYAYASDGVGFPRLGTTLPILLDVDNDDDGAAASGVRLTSTLPASVQFLSVDAPDWACSSGTPLTCSRASLETGSYSLLTETVRLPQVPQSGIISLTVTSSGSDLYPADNTSSAWLGAFAHSANGNPWDVGDKLVSGMGTQDTGAMDDAGQDAFDGFGFLSVVDPGRVVWGHVPGFGLTYSPGHHWTTTTPVLAMGLTLSRRLDAPAGANWLRYIDTITNTLPTQQTVFVGWGGNLGSDSNTRTAATSSGDQVLDHNDFWAVTAQQTSLGAPAGDAVVGYAFRGPGDTTYLGPFVDGIPITGTVWPQPGNDNLDHVFQLTVAPGASASLAYFVYRGLAEGWAGPQDCQFYGGCVTPATGSQVALAVGNVAWLATGAGFCDLSLAEQARLANWPGLAVRCNSTYLPTVRR